MATEAPTQAQRDEKHAAGTFRLTDEEADELEQADIEAEEDRRLGRLIPLEEVLAKLGRS
jgi:hypothetical protein